MNVRGKFLSLLVAIVCLPALCACTGKHNLSQRLSKKPSVAQLRDGDCVAINENHPGEELDVVKSLKLGKFTVVEFTSDY